MLAPILAAVCLFAGDVNAPSPARIPGDPPPPITLGVPDRGPQIPAPLPVLPSPQTDATVHLTPRDVRRMAILPTGSLAAGLLVPVALGTRGGDWGTPATEILAGWGGGYAGLSITLGLTALVEQAGPMPDPKIGFNRGAAGFAVAGVVLLTPAATGAAVWLAGEGMQGRSLHPTENLLVAMGGAFATELAFGGTALALHQPPGPAMSLAFIPIAAGATIAYDLARGPHRGPRRAVMPILTLRF